MLDRIPGFRDFGRVEKIRERKSGQSAKHRIVIAEERIRQPLDFSRRLQQFMSANHNRCAEVRPEAGHNIVDKNAGIAFDANYFAGYAGDRTQLRADLSPSGLAFLFIRRCLHEWMLVII